MKHFISFILATVLIPLLYTVSYYFVEIRKNEGEIDRKIALYSETTSNHLLMREIALQEETQLGILRFSAHSLAVDLHDGHFRNFWNLAGLHWHVWLRVLYSDSEIFRIWLSMAPYGEGRGMNEASEHYFAKSIDKLSCYQIAQLVVMVRSPSMFKPGSTRSEKRIENRGVSSRCAANKSINFTLSASDSLHVASPQTADY